MPDPMLHRERPTPPTWETTRKATNLTRLLGAAETLGLPQPQSIIINPYGILGIHLILADEWGYAAWLDMLDKPVTHDFTSDGRIFRTAKGHWGDVYVEMQTDTAVDEVAA